MRRWYAAVPVLVMVLLVGPRLVGSADPEYQAEGSVVVLPFDSTAAARTDDEGVPPPNPYTQFTGSVSITAAVLESIGRGDTLRQRVVDEGGTDDFSIEQDEETPILVIEATSDRRALAIDSVSIIASVLDSELAAQQEQLGVPTESRIVTRPIVLPERASELETARNRALTIVIALGLAGVIAATVIAESFAQGHARNRQEMAERAAAARAARIAHVSSTSRDLELRTGLPRPPDPPRFESANGQPATPAEPRQR